MGRRPCEGDAEIGVFWPRAWAFEDRQQPQTLRVHKAGGTRGFLAELCWLLPQKERDGGQPVQLTENLPRVGMSLAQQKRRANVSSDNDTERINPQAGETGWLPAQLCKHWRAGNGKAGGPGALSSTERTHRERY